jgi:glycosyltransferase involved in cell wall biosynthesis
LVSVVIPCFNHGQFLGNAIESVLAQTYENFEIIVVDDGSTDDTADVAKRYPSVKYIRQQNTGRSAARNAGLQQSRGEFVAFLDADDRFLAHALRTGADCLAQHPECAFVSGHCRVIDTTGSVLAAPRQRCVPRDHYIELLRGGTYIWCPASVLYRRRVFDFVHGFDPAVVPVEDYDLYLRITKDFPVHCHAQVIAEYRQHSSNTSRDLARMQKAALAAHSAQWDFAKANREYRQAHKIGERFWREQYPLQHMSRRIREIVTERLPADAIVAIASGDHTELLRLDNRQALPFPPPSFTGGALFAQGATGHLKTLAWIEPGMTYQFSLYRGTDHADLLARLFVRGVANPTLNATADAVPPRQLHNNGVVLTADPNPVLAAEQPGTTTITWSTGDGSEGAVYVTGGSVGGEPTGSTEAWNSLETIKEMGAQFLLIPARSFWLRAEFQEFRERVENSYRVVIREENACIMFDLRTPPPDRTA